MADITTSTSPRSKRRPTPRLHLDMTPLVDLGLLLITFFMLTTHLIDQRVMELKPPIPGNATLANNTLTVILDAAGRQYGYQGEFNTATVLEPLGGRTLRNSLKAFRALSKQVEQTPTCIVKVADGVRFQQVVTTLDEIQYALIDQFTLVDSVTSAERALIAMMRSD